MSSLSICDYDAGLLFSNRETGIMIQGYAESSPLVPPIPAPYILPGWASDLIVWAIHPYIDPLFLCGDTGCGKTSCVKYIAGKLNIPVVEINAHGRLEFSDLCGHFTVENGSLKYIYGPLPLAMSMGAWLLINEFDLLPPDTAAGLNSILDGSPLVLTENGAEVVRSSGLFRVIATGNSNGAGDQSGYYQGVLRQNMALMDRFSLVSCGYLPKSHELALLRATFPEFLSPPYDSIAEKMVDYANLVRAIFSGKCEDPSVTAASMNGSIEITFSARTLLRWARLILAYAPSAASGVDVIQHALDRALLFRAIPDTKFGLTELKQRIFGGPSD